MNKKVFREFLVRKKLSSAQVSSSLRMKQALKNMFLAALAIAAPGLAVAQNPIGSMTAMGFGDVAEIKQKAESGNATAQVALGDVLVSRFRSTEARQWYQKAAAKGSVEGEFHLGQMLLFGAPGIPLEQAVRPNPSEGLQWTYMAATNGHAHAWWNMGKALSQGLGTSTNLVASYAWLKLFSETPSGSIVGTVQMNELALKLDSASLQKARDLALAFKKGKWQPPVIRTLPEGDRRLRLSSISFGGSKSLAIINGRTLSEGEEGNIQINSEALLIKCLRIEHDSVTIKVEGEEPPRILRLK